MCSVEVILLGADYQMMMIFEYLSFPYFDMLQFSVSCFLFVVTFVGTKYFKINPIKMILYCGGAGWLLL